MIDLKRASQVALVVKNQPATAGDVKDFGSIPGLGRPLGEGNGNPLQYSCLENPMERGAWWAIVHGVTKESNMTEWLNSSNSSSVIVFGKMLHICALNVFIYWFQLSVTLRHTKLIQAERTLLHKIYF